MTVSIAKLLQCVVMMLSMSWTDRGGHYHERIIEMPGWAGMLATATKRCAIVANQVSDVISDVYGVPADSVRWSCSKEAKT